MRIIDVNHASSREEFKAQGNPPDAQDIHHLKVQGAGVVITLIQRPNEGIDITVNPSNEPYMHRVKVGDLAAHSTQVRVHGVKGSPLG